MAAIKGNSRLRLFWIAALVLAVIAFAMSWRFGGMALFAISVLLAIFEYLRSKQEPERHSVESVAALLSCVALLMAGYWFFIERRSVPKVNVVPQIQTFNIGDGTALARVELLIENVGNTAVEIDRDDKVVLNIGQVLPLRGGHAADMQRAFRRVEPGDEALGIMRTDKYPTIARLDRSFDLREKEEDRHNDQLEFKIEAGETERRYFKAIIPCEDGLISSVRVELPKKLNWFQRLLEDDQTQHVWRGQAVSEEIPVCLKEED